MFFSYCEGALEYIDYFGYFTGFPFYQIIAVCSNSTHEMMYTIKVYSSGDYDFTLGDIIKLDESLAKNYEI